MNRIHVVAHDNGITSQARTYAEYRVFAALTRHALEFRRVRVLLRSSDDRGPCDRVSCSVSVALEPSGSVRVRSTGPHVYAAINRAVERLGRVLGERNRAATFILTLIAFVAFTVHHVALVIAHGLLDGLAAIVLGEQTAIAAEGPSLLRSP